MCRSMADIRSTAAEIRRGKKEDRRKEGKKLQGKNIMAPLLHRAAINRPWCCSVGAGDVSHCQYDVLSTPSASDEAIPPRTCIYISLPQTTPRGFIDTCLPHSHNHQGRTDPQTTQQPHTTQLQRQNYWRRRRRKASTVSFRFSQN